VCSSDLPTEKALRAIKFLYENCSNAAGRLELVIHGSEAGSACPGKHLKFFIESGLDVEVALREGHAILDLAEEPLVVLEDQAVLEVPRRALGISSATSVPPPGLGECAAVGETLIGTMEKSTNYPDRRDFTDRHLPGYYPYSLRLSYQALLRAAHQEILAEEDYDQRLQALYLLKDLGLITRVFPAEGEKWVPLFRTAWRKWQEKQNMPPAQANGIPKPTSVYTLAVRSGLEFWDEERQSNSLEVKLPRTTPPKSAPPLSNPTVRGSITMPFGKKADNANYWKSFGRHTGVDFARTSAESDKVLAVDSGTVSTHYSSILGHVAVLKADSLRGTTHQYVWYCHLAEPSVEGKVERGQVIGRMGDTGTGSTEVHLHLEVQRSGTSWGTTWGDFTDPAPLLDL
jgi:murein DD-endopeptidase MepM/ murein hydrolase activator NlpD